MDKHITIHQVDLTTIEDCFQMGEFERLNRYFLFLLDLIDTGVKIALVRYPVNSTAVCWGVIRNFSDFEGWVTPFLNQG